VQGSTQVAVTAINNSGTYVGFAVFENSQTGFIQSGTTFTAIQGPCDTAAYCTGYPTDINNKGTVTGVVEGGRTGGFVWKDGAFVSGDFFTMTSGEGPYAAYAGEPSAPVQLGGFGLEPNNALVTGINVLGYVVGIGLPQGTNGEYLHFVGKKGVFADLFASTGSGVSYNTLINDKGEVVFSVGDAIIVYANNAYTTVNLPSQAVNATVQALNNAGRIVGTYLDSTTNMQTVFLYNGRTLSNVGSYPGADQLRVAMNARAVMVVNDIANHSGVGVSYLVKCKGPGC
jgi:uncharacterized membrane protein